MGAAALEYSGLSTVADATVMDQSAHATGTTSGAATVASGATPATGAANELALGLYEDSGFGASLTPGSGWTSRANVSPTADMEFLAEDQVLSAGSTPNATVGTGANTQWLMATVVLKAGAAPPPTAPAAPTNVSATAGNTQATVTWAAPSNGGSAITSYTVTPFIGSAAQTPVTVTGTPPATSATVAGLANGTAYTFTVTATNAIGTGPASAPSNSVTPTANPPTFVQQVGGHFSAVTSAIVTPTASITTGNRLVVLVGVWSAGSATAATVTDTAGNAYSELQHFKAPDGTELSVWSAPITAGGGTKPAVTVKPTAGADVGVGVLEYSGLSTVADATVVDQSAQATGTTGSAGTVLSGPTPAATTSGELGLGFYVDSGFGNALTAGSGFTSRLNISPEPDIEVLAEDRSVSQGATVNAGAGTGASTTWLMSSLILKHS
jgi:hypothetical protein